MPTCRSYLATYGIIECLYATAPYTSQSTFRLSASFGLPSRIPKLLLGPQGDVQNCAFKCIVSGESCMTERGPGTTLVRASLRSPLPPSHNVIDFDTLRQLSGFERRT